MGRPCSEAAAKNHKDATVVCDPVDYDRVLDSMKSGEDLTSLRKELALKVFFQKTSAYDGAISAYLDSQYRSAPDLDEISGFPESLNIDAKKIDDPWRYGENPHQQASLYGDLLDHFTQLQGKELSYNNILDISAAAYLIGEFERPTVAILKHTNPCGVSLPEKPGSRLATGVRDGPAGSLWRNYRRKQHRRRSACRADWRDILRSDYCPGFH